MVQLNRTTRDALVIGIIGFCSVAVFYAIFDLLAARGALYTVDLLGKALFRGLRDPAVLALPMDLDLRVIFWYSAVHLFVSILVGFVVASLLEHSERKPSQARFIFGIIVSGFVVTIVAVSMLTTSIRLLLPWWSIVAANAFAVLMAGSYLLRRRPDIQRMLSALKG